MRETTQTAINVENLRKVFYSVSGFWHQTRRPVVAVEDISFNVSRGELFGLVGPNGAGKTTTVKMLSTLLLPTSGTARIFGIDVRDTAHIRPRIGFTFGGNKGLYTRLTGLDNLRYFGELYKIPPHIAKKRIHDLLQVVGLAGRENDRVETYSSGMQQRLHLARALLHNPQLIFLDEPTIGIDPVGAREIRQLIKQLVRYGHTILLTSHYMYEVEELCDRIAVINHGSIIAMDTPSALKARSSGESVIVVQMARNNRQLQQQLEALRGCLTSVDANHDSLSLHTLEPSTVLHALTPLLEQKLITNMEVRSVTLEDVYVDIIKNHSG
jgi:ABC-2 type transport system ATP-binding protein